MTDAEYYRAWREKNRERLKQYQAVYRTQNREKFRENRRRFIERNPDADKKYSKKYRDANPNQRALSCKAYRDANKEKEQAYRKEYSQKNKDKLTAKAAKRRAVQKRALPAWADLEVIAEVYRHARELSAISGLPFHVDHIVPLQSKLVCGLHCEANLQIIYGPENISKNNRHWPNMP